MTDGEVGPAVTSRQNAHAGAHTCARLRSHEREAHRSFHCADISFLKHTQKLSSLSHMSSMPQSQQSEPPWKGTFLSVKKQPSRAPQSYAQVRNGLFICHPPLYGLAPTFSCHCCTAKKCLCGYVILTRKLIKLSETFFGAFVHCKEENCREMNKVITQNRNKIRDFVYMF